MAAETASLAGLPVEDTLLPLRTQIPLGQKVLGGVSLAVSLFAIITFTALFHDGNMGCLTSCAAVGAATLILGIYLLAFKGRPRSFNDKILTVEKRRTYTLVGAIASTVIFGVCLGLAAHYGSGQVGCMTACTALVTASFVTACCIAAKKREKWGYCTQTSYDFTRTLTKGVVPDEFLKRSAFYHNHQKISIEVPGQQQLTALLSGYEFVDKSVFIEALGMCGIRDDGTLWQQWRQGLLEKIRPFQLCTEFMRLVAEDTADAMNQNSGKAFHLTDKFLEVVDNVTIKRDQTSFEMTRRRKYNLLGRCTTEYSFDTKSQASSFFTK